MVAVARRSPVAVPHLVLVGSSSPASPGPKAARAVSYRRRRLVAAAAFAVVVSALAFAVQAVVAPSGTDLAHSVRSAQPAATVHVVQPGETFWSIAQKLRPADDPRPLVARMVAAHGSPALVVGERVPLPPP